MDIIEKYPDKPWNWEFISKNPNITIDIIEKYPDKFWSYYSVSNNPNITIEFIEKNIEEINITELSKNKFTYQNKLNKMKKSILALEKTKNRFPKDVNMYIIKYYL